MIEAKKKRKGGVVITRPSVDPDSHCRSECPCPDKRGPDEVQSVTAGDR
jgi:hypothetical protein